MIHLSIPDTCNDFSHIISQCCACISKTDYKDKLIRSKPTLLRLEKIYHKHAQSNRLYLYSKHQKKQIKNIFLSDQDSISLYDNCLVKKRCGGIYEKIINSAKSSEIQCPFCGGISPPNNLDHFLPKSIYSYFSILPHNLIPICRDCNSQYKKNFFPFDKKHQLIHPYLDNPCFFNEQWLFAEYLSDGSEFGTIKYFVEPPSSWSIDQKEKVKFHFSKFNLADRYAIHSCTHLAVLITTLRDYKKNGISERIFTECSIDSIIKEEKRPNTWKNAFYLSIKKSISTIWSQN